MNRSRIGKFTSSEIAALMSEGKKAGTFGAPATTYIVEKNMERRLGRSLDGELKSRATDWGSLVESHVFSLLPLDYSTISKNTIIHPDHPDTWCGSPDSICYDAAFIDGQPTTVKIIVDIKSPFTLKSFCTIVDAWHAGGITAIRDQHKDGEKFYWQIVSNAILTGSDAGELIVYAPYKSELDAIRELAAIQDQTWMQYATDDELPYLVDGGYYKNINHFRFDIPPADKQKLTARVVQAAELLWKPEMVIS